MTTFLAIADLVLALVAFYTSSVATFNLFMGNHGKTAAYYSAACYSLLLMKL